MTATRLGVRSRLAGQYPFTSHFFELNGLRRHYLDEAPTHDVTGDGPASTGPLLFVHGNPTWSFAWRNIIRGLSCDYRCLAVDHVGCGLSDKPQDYDYTLAQHVENLVRFVEGLDLRDVTLVGHDWGGCIGMGAAVRRPERFKRFVLMNTAAFRSRRLPLRIAVCRIPFFGTLAVRGLNLFARMALRMAVAKPLPADVKAGYLAPYDSWGSRIAIHRFVQDIPLRPAHRSYETLTEIEESLSRFREHPFLFLWGMQDWCFTPAFLEEWVRRFPSAEVHCFEDASHYLFEDAPDEVTRRIREFLKRNPVFSKSRVSESAPPAPPN